MQKAFSRCLARAARRKAEHGVARLWLVLDSRRRRMPQRYSGGRPREGRLGKAGGHDPLAAPTLEATVAYVATRSPISDTYVRFQYVEHSPLPLDTATLATGFVSAHRGDAMMFAIGVPGKIWAIVMLCLLPLSW
jgi:hypothetical protein